MTHPMTNRDEARERLAAALDLLPRIKSRLKSGQQPNAYEAGSGYVVGIGPVTNCLTLATTTHEGGAALLEQALRLALLSDQPLPSVATGQPNQGRGVMVNQALTGVGWFFSASHRDPVRKELHGHSYEVTCWFNSDGRDAVVLQEGLKAALMAFDHKTLPDELSRAEDLASAIMHLMGCEGVEINRPVERLRVKVGRCG